MVANTCIESTGSFGMELGYHVTLVKDATAAFSRDARLPPIGLTNTNRSSLASWSLSCSERQPHRPVRRTASKTESIPLISS
jgi:Isochorismatase family